MQHATCSDARVAHVPVASSNTMQLALEGDDLENTTWSLPFKSHHVRLAVAAATVPHHVFVRAVRERARNPMMPHLLTNVTTVADYLDAPAALQSLKLATTALLEA